MTFRRTFRITRSKPDAARDVSDEIQFHIEMRQQELIEQGMSPGDARRAARASFGDRRRIESECVEETSAFHKKTRRVEFLGSIQRDLRFAFRDYLRRLGFFLAACLTLTLCIGANSAVFSVIQGVLWRPLAFPASERIVRLYNSYPHSNLDRTGNSVIDFLERRQNVDAFREVALFAQRGQAVGEKGSQRRVFSLLVTPSFFPLLRVSTMRGRTFTEEESEPGNDRKAIISHRLWQDLFGGGKVIGEALRVEGVPLTVVGVLPSDFRFPTWDADLWLPITLSQLRKSEKARYDNTYAMLARLEPGSTVRIAQEQIDTLNAANRASIPAESRELVSASGFRTEVVGFQDDLTRQVRFPLLLLWGGVLFVLLIGCLNIANLLLARAKRRITEMATRFALGASRRRLVRQLLTESMLLASVGGVLGVAAGSWGLGLLDSFQVYQIPRVDEVSIDAATLLFTLAATTFVGLIAGLVPAAALREGDLHSLIRAGTGSGGSIARRGSLGATVAVAQISIAFVLLTGAGLLFASLGNVRSIDPGFETDRLLCSAITVPPRYRNRDSRNGFIDSLVGEIRTLPGVEQAAIASQLPFSGFENRGVITPRGLVRKPNEPALTHYSTVVSSGYFEALGLPLLEGRAFQDGDTSRSEPVAIVDALVARRYWPQRTAVGRKIFLGLDPREGSRWHTVVGVVGEVVQKDLAAHEPIGAIYQPFQQTGIGFMRLVVKTESAP